MTEQGLETINNKIEEIRRLAVDEMDDEAAHSREDGLRHKILEIISTCEDAEFSQRLAKLALSTSNIEFSRWCA